MSNVLLMSGKVLLDRLTDAGESTGYLDAAEIGTLEIEEKTDLKTLQSKGRTTYGQTIATVALKKPSTLKMTLNEVNPAMLAVALLGESAALTQVAGTVSSGTPSVISLIPDRWVPLPYQNITPHVAVTSPIVITTVTGDTDVPLTDVEIDTRLGMVKYIGSTYTAATPVECTYKYGAMTGTRVSGSVKPTVKMRILLDGKNMVDGNDVRLLIDEATLTPAKPIDFASEDFSVIEFEGELTTLAGKTSPYIVDVLA
ncbi:hypothetical protein [Chromatium okenii]|jgi:hypothetical protein|uniref:phage tail tube protein n=1 Tax=Chromatium okenii TaxID=61644 RepID=UPI0026EAC1EB|nr:hypothetical protein [Chromatium okenii]MBV5310824.1 hypothetical protein [Chromatium okenii]